MSIFSDKRAVNLIGIVIVLFLCGCAVPTQRTSKVITLSKLDNNSKVVCDNPFEQVCPTIDQNRVVWVDYRNSLGSNNGDIFMHGLAMRRQVGVCLNSANQYVPDIFGDRSEERRVGKECRSRWSPCH